MRVALVVVMASELLFACDKGRVDPTPEPKPVPVPMPAPADARALSCDEARPEHTAMVEAQQSAFRDALVRGGYSPAGLEEIWIRDRIEIEGQQIDELRATSYKRRRVIVTYPFDRANGPSFGEPELVADRAGGVWNVRKNHRASSTKTVLVDACQWGCFGVMPRGAQDVPDHGRRAWLLRDGQTFRGEVVIDVEAPHVNFQPTQSNCPPPA